MSVCAHIVCLRAGWEHLWLPASIRWGLESSSGLRVSLELSVSLSDAQVHTNVFLLTQLVPVNFTWRASHIAAGVFCGAENFALDSQQEHSGQLLAAT